MMIISIHYTIKAIKFNSWIFFLICDKIVLSNKFVSPERPLSQRGFTILKDNT